MKITTYGNMYLNLKRFTAGLLGVSMIAASFISCNEDAARPDRPSEDEHLWTITPQLTDVQKEFEGIDQYGVSLYLFNEMSSNCNMHQYARSFADIEPFVVERASYSLVAFMMDYDALNILYENSKNAHINDDIVVTDFEQEIPDMVLTSVPVKNLEDNTVSLKNFNRLVGKLDISLNNADESIASIEVNVGNLYDRVSFKGIYSCSDDRPSNKNIKLTKDGNRFTCSTVLMPSLKETSKVPLVFTVIDDNNATQYNVSLEGRIVEGKIVSLNGDCSDILQKGELTTEIHYTEWNNSVTIEDGFKIEGNTDKEWIRKDLPIGGSDSFNNFYASSSLINDWAKCYDSYLYDGIKDASDEHKDMYWAPDCNYEAESKTIPCWYLDMGNEYQGISITYWNKFGGAGGQKINTMNIYGSNLESDYQAGNDSWTLITTFTSDKTKPQVDAGAEVNTGRIEFSEGNTSFRYIKCEFTSRIDNKGNKIEDSDVNVSEVKFVVWNCR